MLLCRLAVLLLTFFFSGDHTPEMPSSNRVTRHNQIRISRQCRSTRKRLGGGTPYSCYSHSSQVGSFEDLHQFIRINLIFPTGLIVVLKGQTSLPWWSYIVALVLGGFITVRFLDVAERQRCTHCLPTAILYPSLWTHGNRCGHKPAHEDGSWCPQPRKTGGEPLCMRAMFNGSFLTKNSSSFRCGVTML